jgi:hypothetical protein
VFESVKSYQPHPTLLIRLELPNRIDHNRSPDEVGSQLLGLCGNFYELYDNKTIFCQFEYKENWCQCQLFWHYCLPLSFQGCKIFHADIYALANTHTLV